MISAGLITRYGLAGLANTLFGLGVIAGLDLGLGWNPQLANAAGYALAIAISYGVNRAFVFRSERRAIETAPRFLAAIVCAFLLNQASLLAASAILGDSHWARLLAQLTGMGIYSASLFLFCRFWIFAHASSTAGKP